MSSRKTRRGIETGFIGATRAQPEDVEEVHAGDFGDNFATGLDGFKGSNGTHNSGFRGLANNSKGGSRGNDTAKITPVRDPPHGLFQNKPPTPRKRPIMQKPVEKPLTHIDKQTVGKVVELKDKFQRLKDRTKEKERDLAVTDMKIEALVERIKEIDSKKNEFKDQLYEERKKNHVLKKKLENNEQDKLDLEQQLETGIKPTRKRKGKGIGNVDLENHQQLLQEQMRKEREEMRRQLFAGIDFLGAGQLRVAEGQKKN